METEKMIIKNVHHGHNIKRIREARGIKQLEMAKSMNLSQQAVSKYEKKKEIDDETLKRFADFLHVTLEDIKSIEDAPITIVFESIDNHDNKNTGGVDVSAYSEGINVNNHNVIDKVSDLYERMLKNAQEEINSLKEKNNSLEKRIAELEEKGR